jgi:hypothetical protein
MKTPVITCDSCMGNIDESGWVIEDIQGEEIPSFEIMPWTKREGLRDNMKHACSTRCAMRLTKVFLDSAKIDETKKKSPTYGFSYRLGFPFLGGDDMGGGDK